MSDFVLATDRSAEVLMEKNAAVVKALAVIALQMEKNAKLEITNKVYDQPISKSGYKRTNRLRGSITAESDGNSAQVGTDTEYAPYVELGTYKMAARPFIKPAVEEHLDEYKAIFERILQGAQ